MFDLYWHFHCTGCPKLMQHYRNVLCAIIFMLLLQDSCLIRKAIRSANRADWWKISHWLLRLKRAKRELETVAMQTYYYLHGTFNFIFCFELKLVIWALFLSLKKKKTVLLRSLVKLIVVWRHVSVPVSETHVCSG